MDIIPQLIVNALITGSIYALASSGLALTYGLLRVLNFAHGHLMMSGVYIFYWGHVILGLNILNSALLTLIASSILAIVVFRIFVFPFSRLSIVLTLVTTLALSNILESLVSMTFGVNVKSLTSSSAI